MKQKIVEKDIKKIVEKRLKYFVRKNGVKCQGTEALYRLWGAQPASINFHKNKIEKEYYGGYFIPMSSLKARKKELEDRMEKAKKYIELINEIMEG